MNPGDRRWIALFLILGGVGFATFLHLYPVAFPEASLDFRLSPDEVRERAAAYVDSLGLDTEGYNSARIFSHDYLGQVFLERTIGLNHANELAREWLSIWRWKVRWYKPLEKEEIQVDVDPGGRVVGFRHLVLDSKPGSSLSEPRAREIAETFLQDNHGVDLAGFEPVEHSSQQRPARVDHTFIYRKAEFRAGDDGHYRLKAVVQGSEIGVFDEYVYVPETFRRHHDDVRSQAGLLSQVAGVGYLALVVVMFVVLVQRFRHGKLRWRTPLIVGLAVAVTNVAVVFNSMPLSLFNYDTTQSFSSFLAQLVAGGVLLALLYGGIITLAGAAGGAAGSLLPAPEPTMKRRDPLGRLRWARMFTPDFLRTVLIGYGLAFIMAGYVTVFYVIGSRYLGVWSPAQVSDYNNTFSTAIPWVYPLLVGLAAATLEEFFFRLLAISVLLRWFGRRWLAVLLPAVVWAFLHSNHPIEPIYTRGVELTVIGCLFGLVYLRFGIWATITAHYVFNAFLVALPMIKSSSSYFQISGALVVGVLLLPVIPVAISLLSGWRPTAAEEEAEEEEPEEETRETPSTRAAPALAYSSAVIRPEQRSVASYRADRRGWFVGGVAAVVGVVLLVGLRVDRFGESLALATTQWEAVERGAEFLRGAEMLPDANDYHTAVWFSNNLGSDNYTHLIRHAGLERADSLASARTHPWRWRVRWFKDKEKEEFRVSIGPRGSVVSFDHTIPENAPGPMWPADSARVAVEAFARQRFQVDVADTAHYALLEATEEKQEARMDHHFVWESTTDKVEEGEFRTDTRFQGDRFGRFNVWYKAPEEFLRDLREKGIKDSVAPVLIAVLAIGSLVLGGIYFFRGYRDGEITWSAGIRWGLVVGVAMLVDEVNGMAGYFAGYDTSESLATFIAKDSLGLLVKVAFTAGSAAVIVALCLCLYRSVYPQDLDPAQWLHLCRRGLVDARFAGGAVLLAVAAFLTTEGIDQLERFITHTWLVDYLRAGGSSPHGLGYYVPALSGLSAAAKVPLTLFAMLGLLLIWRRFLGSEWAVAVLATVGLVLPAAAGSAEDWSHFAWLLPLMLLPLAGTLLFVLCVIRFNLLVYLVFLWFGVLLDSGWSLVQTEHLFLQANGAAMLILGLLPLALPLWVRSVARRDATSGPPG